MSFHIDGRGEFDDNYRSRQKVIAEINMTPFVDVCLVLLIIFMVTAPFAISGINIKLPETKAKPLSVTSRSLILSISKKGEFYIQKNLVAENDLVLKIKEATEQTQDNSIFIRADENVPYKKVMEAMAAAQRAGISKIGMIGENKLK
jgi:biopolymer transport protein TolR